MLSRLILILVIGVAALGLIACGEKETQEDEGLKFSVDGEVAPGQEIELQVLSEDTNIGVQNAVLTLNGKEVGRTDSQGRITISIPADATSVNIVASSSGFKGELGIEFHENGQGVLVAEGTDLESGNFRFLVSDEVNAIGDFASLVVDISKIGVNQNGESGDWKEFYPEVHTVDLTQLQGVNAQEIWSGDLEPGEYSKVFIYVEQVTGVLAESEVEVEVMLPSEKLQISEPFEVTEFSTTSYVYDLTVVAAGNGENGPVKYILQPQIGQSGPDQRYSEIKGLEGNEAGPPETPGNDGGPPNGGESDEEVPAGLTRVTHIFFDDRAAERTIEHGPGNVPPPRRQEGSACPEGGGTDQCTTNSWSGNSWGSASLPVEWSLNLQDANTDRAEGDSPDAFQAAFVAASGTWESAPNSSFDATYLGQTSRSGSSFRGGPSFQRMDGNNDIDFGDLAGRYGNAIAMVIYWYSTASGEILEADMRFNKDYPWTTNATFTGDPGNNCCYDVLNIAVHEFGHFHAGLIDQYDADESELTMYGYGSLGEVKKRTLALGDQLSIASAYPLAATGNPPAADAGDPYSGTEDISISFDGSGSSDPEGDPLTYTWDFGDGTVGAGVSPSHTYLWGGVFTVTLTVDDGNGNRDASSTTATVTEVNDEPSADAGGPYSGSAGGAITFDASGSSDFDNEDGTDANDQTMTYYWDFGDESTDSTNSTTIAHSYSEDGTYTVTLVANDTVVDSVSVSTSAVVSEPAAGVSVTDVVPSTVPSGGSVDVIITGTGFAPEATVSLEGGEGPTPDVIVNFVDATTIEATIQTKDGGPPRPRSWNVRVTNEDGGTGVLEGGFEVTL